MPVITLLTDFGVDDEYVGSMKGVVLSIAPEVTLVDISHHIDPQDIVQAAYLIASTYGYFPKNTVHLVVVDPGVGSDRSIIAVRTETQYFVAPDNGVLTFILEKERLTQAVRIENAAYFLQPVSTTFHGRDIFAPVGAHIARGVRLNELGPVEDSRNLLRIPIQRPHVTPAGELVGQVVWSDRFGNLITNIDSNTLINFQKSGLTESLGICVMFDQVMDHRHETAIFYIEKARTGYKRLNAIRFCPQKSIRIEQILLFEILYRYADVAPRGVLGEYCADNNLKLAVSGPPVLPSVCAIEHIKYIL